MLECHGIRRDSYNGKTVRVEATLLVALALAVWVPIAVHAQEAAPVEPPDSTASETQEAADTDTDADAASAGAESPEDRLNEAIAALRTQLEAQSQQITALQAQYSSEVDARQKEIDGQQKLIKAQAEQMEDQRQAVQSLQQQVDTMASLTEESLTEAQAEVRSRLQTVEQSIQASQKAESTEYDITSFPGSIPVPGSSAAVRVSGFVKMNIVESFDPIGTDDRFIVASIPVPQTGGPSQASMTVSQSRLNLDLRETTDAGHLRAFVEGDFAGTGDTFRLRHAFGQYKSLLIGKTWSAFMDAQAVPEDLDFEGINGQILIRQPQVRYFPTIGTNWNLLFSLEDPNPEITGGTARSQLPDVVLSVRRTWFEAWQAKVALLARSIEGVCNCLNGREDKVTGWGLSVSGELAIAKWNQRDNVVFQVNYGKGYGRYVNDLDNVGGQDAIFNLDTGELTPLPVTATYVAFQHWWSATMRSNFSFGYVDVQNLDFQPPQSYKRTHRWSGNLIWSPTARVDVGAELLYGKRENKDGQKGRATQLQISAKYRY